ncbi:class I SAM-dependent RNA methyltransferase [Candidatus Bathyarchaeota archaeon]|nr:class I SAM-dependent RNA methyltransferase [Candidatus Bathyarchaeota archaeon]
MKHLQFFATTPIGVEDIAAEEVKTLTGADPIPEIGRISFQGKTSDIYTLNLKARTLNKIYIQLARTTFQTLEDLYKTAKNLDYTWIIDANQTFAIKSERIGSHNFTSLDISRTIGQAVIDSYQQATGKRLKVNLDQPDVEIYCLVRNHTFLMGVNTTGESLHKRGYRVYDHPAALKPTIAAAMLKISSWTPEKPLLDPMCGGATIPIEAALQAKNIMPSKYREKFAFLKLKICNPQDYQKTRENIQNEEKTEAKTQIYAMEKIQKHLNGGIRNAEKANVQDAIIFKIGDATKPEDYPDKQFSHIIVNPPYGLRAHPKEGVRKLYENFLKALKTRNPNATLTLITAASKRFKEAAEKTNITIIKSRKIWHGDLPT